MKRSLLLLLTVAALAGCGGDDDDDGGSGPVDRSGDNTPTATTGEEQGAGTGESARVTMENIEYVPKTITVKSGQKIEWENTDSVAHTVTATEGADFDSGTMEVGDKFDFTPQEAGEIQYFCEIHPNQKGTVTVTE